ncbi:MAG: hypothetical protein LUE19_09750 [Clostridiales bacterium]|nr:hypothetical protein [Clostridiales bacterium]
MKFCYKKVIALLLIALIPAGLTGCKESLAFEQIEYNQDSEDIRDDDELIDNDEENEEEDEDIASKEEDEDSEKDRNYDESEQMHDDNADDDSAGANTSYNENASSLGESNLASADASVSDSSSSGTGTSSDSSGTVQSGGNSSSSSTGGSGEASDSGEEDAGSGSGDSNDENNAGINAEDDDDGSSLNVGGGDLSDGELSLSYGTVIATGEAAILTQMLGGSGSVAATDATTYAAMSAYFPADELSGIVILWDGDSTGTLSESGLSELTSDGTIPSGCLMDASALNEADVTTLTEMGVSCTALSFESYSDILASVETAASALGTDQSSSMKEAYTSFCSQVTEAVSGYESWKYTMYVSGWDSSAQLSFSTTSGSFSWSSQYGLAVGSHLSSSPADDMWELAGIYNNYSSPSKNTRGGSYVAAAATVDYIYLNQFSLISCSVKNLTGSYLYESMNNALLYNLGEDNYPALVVASQSIKTQLETDRDSGSGMLSVYPQELNGHFLTGSGQSIQAYISGDYEVYVNPCGLGDWMEGSAESILEAVWAAYQIQGTCTYNDVVSYVKQFYSTFYRCSLTDAQVTAILAGNAS